MGVVGSGPTDDAEGTILNRLIWITQNVEELEADPTHAELIIEELGLSNSKWGREPRRGSHRHC